MKADLSANPVDPDIKLVDALDRIRNSAAAFDWSNLNLTSVNLEWLLNGMSNLRAQRRWTIANFIGNSLPSDVLIRIVDTLDARYTDFFGGTATKIDLTGQNMGKIGADNEATLSYIFNWGTPARIVHQCGAGIAYLHDEPDTIYWGTCALTREQVCSALYMCWQLAPDYPHIVKATGTCAPVWQKDVDPFGIVFMLRELGWTIHLSGVIPNPPNINKIVRPRGKTPKPTIAEARTAMRRIVSHGQIDSVHLFGSVARGTHAIGSDIDLLVAADGTGSRWKTKLHAQLRKRILDLPATIQLWIVDRADLPAHWSKFKDPTTQATAIKLYQKS